MPLSILNNIASLAAQNQLSMTGASLQKTLFRLSSGSRINSGADDAAGLAIADGLRANVTALSQSVRNATDGTGKLQVADGALGQVTTLLNRAVTLATESATGTMSSSQRTALNAEFTRIKEEIDRIGNNTTFNGTKIFTTGTDTDKNSMAGATAGVALSDTLTDADTFTVTAGGKSFQFTASSSTVADMINAINADTTVGAKAYLDGTGALILTDPQGRGDLAVDTSDANAMTDFGAFTNPTATVATATDIFLSDSGSASASTISVTIGALSKSAMDYGASSVDISTDDLTSAANAQTALTKINQAIANVAGRRGDIGAAINRLSTATNVMNAQIQNLSQAEDGIRAADIGEEVANMTKFNILNQTGISALAQANQMQQSVLSLLR